MKPFFRRIFRGEFAADQLKSAKRLPIVELLTSPRTHIRRFTRKGFMIELKEQNSLTGSKDFVIANTADVLAAIDRYCQENHHQVTYLSMDPTVFRLDGGDTYRAELVLGRGRFHSGYYIHCTQLTS